MKSLKVHKRSGEIMGVWADGLCPEFHRSSACNYVEVEDDHPLLTVEVDDVTGPACVPTQKIYPDFDNTMNQAGLEAMTKSEIQNLADARGYATVDKESQTQAEMIAAFLDEQNA